TGSDASGAEAQLRNARDRECARMCPMLTRCAVVEGKANPELSAEDRAALDDPRTLEANTNMCIDACGESDLSPRQVSTLQGCNDAMPAQGDPTAAQCAELLGCLDQVAPASP